jgi:hypothetical protein
MTSVPIFTHTAMFKSDREGWNEINVRVLFNGISYTVKLTENGPDYEKERITYMHELPYFPKSLMTLIKTTGQNVFTSLENLYELLIQLCITVQEDQKEVEMMLRLKHEKTISNLEAEMQQLRTDLESSHKCIGNLHLKTKELQKKLTLYSSEVDQSLEMILETSIRELNM